MGAAATWVLLLGVTTTASVLHVVWAFVGPQQQQHLHHPGGGPWRSHHHHQQQQHRRQQQRHQLLLTAKINGEEVASASRSSDSSYSTSPFLAGAAIVELSILPHTPLGCTVEESLAKRPVASTAATKTTTTPLAASASSDASDTECGLVFVSSVKPGSFADQAGLQEGDVILGLSNLFGEVVDVTKEGVERVKGFVLSRPDSEPLELRIARGTRVQEEHERVLVDLCMFLDDEAEECVDAFLQSTYQEDDEAYKIHGDDILECSVDDEADCLVNSMQTLWAEDMEMQLPSYNQTDAAANINGDSSSSSKPKVKPWSSRSSPSGTFVRDPVTGKLKNLDTV